jgi:hypothetical protein
MKRVLSTTIGILTILTFLNGCSNTSTSKSEGDSGSIDEQYVGDADVRLIEEYKQTEEEATNQANLLKKLQEQEAADKESDGEGGHF